MHRFRMTLLLILAASGCDRRSPARREPSSHAPRSPDERDLHANPPGRAGHAGLALDRLDPDSLCVTKGKLERARIDVPTFRAVALGHGGDRAAVEVLVSGTTTTTRALASGQERRQFGLKLRAADGCNLVYVMWRLDPQPKLEVSVKRNPGQRISAECGAGGYTKVTPLVNEVPPELVDGEPHELAAEIVDDTLVAWIDGRITWQGTLPTSARELAGPAGVRSDNLAWELISLSTDQHGGNDVVAKCVDTHSD